MTEKLHNSLFLRACRGEKVPQTPVWLMRQAGRYMKEYRDVREKVGFLELCKNPDLACEVTVVAAKKLGVDAAIIFADILLILEPMGFHLEFSEGKGPLIQNPFRKAADIDRLRDPDATRSLTYVMKALELTRKELPSHIPLIGFSGAPFTIASYAIEGGSSKNFEKTKALMHSDPLTWNQLMERITDGLIDYLNAQTEYGAQALQVFDSWIGVLSEREYNEFVSPHVSRLFKALPEEVPTIHFGVNTGHLLPAMQKAGGDVIGVDFRTSLTQAETLVGQIPLQGNLDPSVLFCPVNVIKKETNRILEEGKTLKGHIFNLGHGILPNTPVENAIALVEYVHEQSEKILSR